MECLTAGEIQTLIALLGKIPSVNQDHVRIALLAGVDESLLNNISSGDTQSHLTNIVTTLGSEAYFRLEDDSYPIITVIQNALLRVRKGYLPVLLQKFLKELCHRCGIVLPQTPIPLHISVLEPNVPSGVDQNFQEELGKCIASVEEFQAKLPQAMAAFSGRIFPTKCREVSSWLEDWCVSICAFAPSLQLSNNPPLAVIANGIWLTRELAYFERETQTLITTIQSFCQMYGFVLVQPQEKQEEIRQQLAQLKQRCASVLEEVRKLARKIDDQFIHLIESDRLP